MNNQPQDNTNREQWLTTAADYLKATVVQPQLDKANIETRPDVKTAISIAAIARKNVLGECWSTQASEDKQTNQIFITAHNNDSQKVLLVLLHELLHAYDDNESGHRGRFALMHKAVGFTGKTTGGEASEQLKETFLDMLDALGPIPHVKLDPEKNGIKKQSARMLKLTCNDCGLVLRASRTQADRIVNSQHAQCPCCASTDYAADLYEQLQGA